MESLPGQLSGTGLHSAVTGVTQPGMASNRLHERPGFERAGTCRQVGFKFGRYRDVTWYQKMFAG